jgi:hypothetical protein
VGAGALALVILGLFWIPFAGVRPSNFGGTDDWVVIDLVSRGIVDFPHANRPLNLVWTLPAPLLMPDDLRGFWLVYGLYLSLGGLVVFALGRSLLPDRPALAFLWAAFTVVWAPHDEARVVAVTGTFYAGVTFGTLLALLFFAESLRGERTAPLVLALGIVFGLATARSHECALPLLMGAPLLLLPLRGGFGRRSLLFLGVWEAAMAGALLLALLPILRPGEFASYQLSAGPPASVRVIAERLVRQFGLHLHPLFTSRPGELLRAAVPLAAGLFAAGVAAALRGPSGDPERAERRRLFAGAGAGLVLAGLGYGGLVLSGTAETERATRMQFFSAPGIALFLACVVLLAASVVPPRRRVWAVALLGSWVVAVGTGRLLALQDARGGWPSFPAQRSFLRQLTREAPHVRSNTLLVLVDEDGVWPATFTFHHSVRYLYEGRAKGFLAQGPAILYGARFAEEGVSFEPAPVIRKAWREEASFHRYDEVVLLRYAGGRLTLVDGPLPGRLVPAGVPYDPRKRLDPSAPAPPARRILG